MLKFCVVLCVLVSLAYADEPAADSIDGDSQSIGPSESEAAELEEVASRLFATISTTTVTNYLTAGTCSVTTSCAALVNATSQCRRRRGLDEQPIILAMDDDVQPSAPLA